MSSPLTFSLKCFPCLLMNFPHLKCPQDYCPHLLVHSMASSSRDYHRPCQFQMTCSHMLTCFGSGGNHLLTSFPHIFLLVRTSFGCLYRYMTAFPTPLDLSNSVLMGGNCRRMKIWKSPVHHYNPLSSNVS